MKNKEIKKLTRDELKKNLTKLKKDFFNLRFKKVNGQLTAPSKITEVKREISRVLTKLNAETK